MSARRRSLVPALVVSVVMLSACGESGREVAVRSDERGCAPLAVTAAPGERLVFVVTNDARGDREVEGIDGTRLEEVAIPAGKTRRVAFTMPASGGARMKCYAPAGPASIIEVTPQ